MNYNKDNPEIIFALRETDDKVFVYLADKDTFENTGKAVDPNELYEDFMDEMCDGCELMYNDNACVYYSEVSCEDGVRNDLEAFGLQENKDLLELFK